MKCGPVKSTATIHHNRAQDGSSRQDIYPWPLLILSVYLSVGKEMISKLIYTLFLFVRVWQLINMYLNIII